MPELPEVETIVRALAPRLCGRRIVTAEVLHSRIVRYSEKDPAALLPGRRIEEVRRHGKCILIRLDQDWLTIHLGMTGQLLFDCERTPHTRAIVQLSDSTLLYDDIRMFGSIELASCPNRVQRLGPDALSGTELHLGLLGRKSPVKAVLLNQTIFGGMGNIYTDEALFRAGIHPKRRADRIGQARAVALFTHIRELLLEAIEHRGSSVSDYVDTDGRVGSFQSLHRVYGREGLPCRRCGHIIKKIVVAGRGTHYCPRCQR